MVEEKIFDKYLGKPGELKLVDENGNVDVFKLEQLGVDYMSDIISVQDALSKIAKDSSTIAQHITSDITQKMNRIVTDTLKLSFPDSNEETLSKFAKNNFMAILLAIFETNSYGFGKTAAIQETLDRVRKGAKDETSQVKETGRAVKS